MDTPHILSSQLKALAVDFIVLLPKIGIALLIALVFIFLGKRLAVALSCRMKVRTGRPASYLMILFERGFRVLFVAIGIFIALSVVIPSLRFSDFIIPLVILGIAIGFGFRNILQNYFAGMIILLTRMFEVGDRIACGVVDGTVEEITLRSTIVRTDAGDRVIVPNGLLMTQGISHRFYSEKGKMSVLFYVPTDAHLEAVIRLTKEIFREMGTAIDAPRSKATFETMTERTIAIRASWRTNQVPPSPRATKEYFVTRLQEELHRYGAHLGLLEMPVSPPGNPAYLNKMDEADNEFPPSDLHS